MKKVIILLVVVAFLAVGCKTVGVYGMYGNTATGQVTLSPVPKKMVEEFMKGKANVSVPGTLKDGSVLKGVVVVLPHDDTGFAPSATVVGELKPDGTFAFQSTAHDKGKTRAITDDVTAIVSSAVNGAVGAAVARPPVNNISVNSGGSPSATGGNATQSQSQFQQIQ